MIICVYIHSIFNYRRSTYIKSYCSRFVFIGQLEKGMNFWLLDSPISAKFLKHILKLNHGDLTYESNMAVTRWSEYSSYEIPSTILLIWLYWVILPGHLHRHQINWKLLEALSCRCYWFPYLAILAPNRKLFLFDVF